MKNLIKIFLSILYLVFGANQAFSAGLAVDAQSVAGLANSHAGETAGVHNISDSYANPAVLSDIKSKQIVLNASYINLNINDNGSSGTINSANLNQGENHNAGVPAVVPSFYIAMPVSDSLVAGLALTAPFALATKYDQNWTGRYLAVESQITTLNINPILSYKVNNNLAVAGGLQAQYLDATMTNMVDVGYLYGASQTKDGIAKARASGWGYGFTLGAKYKFNDNLQLGVGYRSHIKYKLDGTVQVPSLNMVSDLNAPFDTPEIVNFGVAYKITPKSELLYDTSWSRWSRVNTLDINAVQLNSLSSSTKYNWQDSFRYALGFNYQQNSKLQIRTGAAFEQGASGAYRNPRIPDSDKYLVSAGFGYRLKENLNIDFAYMHQFFKTAKVNLAEDNSGTTPISSLQTKFHLRVDVLALGFKYDF